MLGNLLILVVTGGMAILLIWFGRLWSRISTAEKQTDADLAARGVSAQAEVVNHRSSIGKTSSYYITYQYTVQTPGGTPSTYTSEDAIRGSDYRDLNLGDQITVRYLPDDPKTVRIVSGARPANTAQSYLVSGIILICTGVGLAIFGIILFIAGVNSTNRKAAQATAYTLQLSATPNERQKTATVQVAGATQQADLAIVNQLRDALAPRMAEWRKVTDHATHRVLPPETDLNLDEVEIDYGYCNSDHFYTYVWLQQERTNLGYEIFVTLRGYGFVEESQPQSCYPKEFGQVWLRDAGNLGHNWYTVNGAIDLPTRK